MNKQVPNTGKKAPASRTNPRGSIATADGATLETFYSHSSGKVKVAYPHSTPAEFAVIADLDLFEYTLRHQNAINYYGEPGEGSASGVGVAVAPNAPVDGGKLIRNTYERFQNAFLRLQAQSEEVRRLRRLFGDAKGRLVESEELRRTRRHYEKCAGLTVPEQDGLSNLDVETLAKRSRAEIDLTVRIHERRHSLAVAQAQVEFARTMHTAAWHDLRMASLAMKETLRYISKTCFKDIIMSNILCAQSQLKTSWDDRGHSSSERPDIPNIPDLNRYIEDQFELYKAENQK